MSHRRAHFAHRSTISRQVGVLSLVLLYFCACSVVAQEQTPPRSAPTPSKSSSEKPKAPSTVPTGTLKGRVIADDGRVLSNTTVIARGISVPETMKTARVDAQGRFALEELPAAVYVVNAIAPGYVDESTAIGDPEQWPRYLIGSQLRIRLVKGGVITGRVINSKGQAIVGIPVRATPLTGPAFFMNLQGIMGMAETDDRGIYRVYGLAPGQYSVETGGGGPLGRFTSTGFERDVPTYYPSSTYDTAVPVTVRAGEEATGIDIQFKETAGHSISGTVSGKTANVSAPNAINVILSHAGTNSVVGMAIMSTSEQVRSFAFDGIADGEYDLSGFFAMGPNENMAAGTRRLTVRGGDVTGIDLAIASLGSVAGTIGLDPIAPEAKCDKRGSESIEILVQTLRDDSIKGGTKLLATMASAFSSSLSLKGDFSIRNLQSGRFRLAFKLPTDAWYVRAINLPARAAQSDVSAADRIAASGQGRAAGPVPKKFWPGTLTIKSGESVSGVAILVGQDAAGLRGTLSNNPDGSAITQGLRVHLVPAERDEAGNVLRYFEAAVESNGSFALTNIAPGRYFIIPRLETPVTTERVSRPVAFDPTARATLRREAETLNNIVELKPCQRVVDLELKQP